MQIRIPYHPRSAFKAYHASKHRYNVLVCHRRAGKTFATINQLIKDVLVCPLPNPRGLFLAPTFTQAKEIAWNYLKDLTRVIPAIKFMEGELKVVFPNGGQIKLGGAEEIDRYRGQYFDAVVLDEYALMNPSIWTDVLRPAISDRKGRITFIGTPQGQDSFYDIYTYATEESEDWFSMKLKASESGILPPEELQANWKLMTPETYAREFEVDFSATFPGAYYASEIIKAQDDGRIRQVAYDKSVDVYAAFDLGISDNTSIWLFQVVGSEWHFLRFYENNGKGLDHYITWLKNQDYPIEMCFLPHDARARELQSGKSRTAFFEERNVRYTVLDKHAIQDGVNACRMMLNRAWFDKTECKVGLKALQNYKSDYDDKNKVLSLHPLHNWASHAADAFRYGIMGVNEHYALNRKTDWRKPIIRNLKVVA